MGDRIRTLIVDDEPAARAALRGLLEEDSEIAVVGEAADGRSALDKIESERPDLLFLDVQMPEMDGFRVLQQLDVPQTPVIVFVTAYDQYALKAFDAHAIDYLLKPFSDDRFRQALTRAKRQVQHDELGAAGERVRAMLKDLVAEHVGAGRPEKYLARIPVKTGSKVVIVPIADVDWVEAAGDYVRLHVGKGRHVLRESMKEIEAQLDPARFVRIHRSTIVNVDRIKELQPFFRGEYVVLLSDGTSLKLARGYKARLGAALGRMF